MSPGIVSEGEFSDYHYQDIGYHFPNASSEMGEVTDLSVTDQTLSWDTPTYGTPQGYVVIWEDGTGYIIGSIHLSALTTSYEVPEAMTGIGIWFGVSAFSSSGQFGSPVFIQL